jgi:hypothetical protein
MMGGIFTIKGLKTTLLTFTAYAHEFCNITAQVGEGGWG